MNKPMRHQRIIIRRRPGKERKFKKSKRKMKIKSKSKSKVTNKPVFIYNPSIKINLEKNKEKYKDTHKEIRIDGLPPLPSLNGRLQCDEETVRKEVTKLMRIT